MKARILNLFLPVLAATVMFGCSESTMVAPSDEMDVASKKETAAGQQDMNILDTVLFLSDEDRGADQDFTILRDVVVGITNNTDTNLLAALSSDDDQFTVFAPNDAAFIALIDSNEDWNTLGDVVAALGWDGLASVVLYHVTPGRRFAKTVINQKQLPTLNGASITKEKGGTVLNGTVNIIGADAAVTSNGIVHVIDSVLLP